MCRFYGFGYQEVLKMNGDVYYQFLQAIDVLTSEERLMDISVASFPHSEKNSRERMKRSLHKGARPELFESDRTNQISMKEFGKVLAGMSGGR